MSHRQEEIPLNPRTIALTASLAWSLAGPAAASTLPPLDIGTRPIVSAGGGQSLNLGFDTPVDDRLALGASIGSRTFVGAHAGVRATYRMLSSGRDPLTVSGVLGAQASGPAFQNLTAVAPVVGLAGAWPLAPAWTLQAYAVFALYGADQLRPAGVEVSYRVEPRLELTLGYNGRGDVIGLRWTL
jgi:hypothetical protein